MFFAFSRPVYISDERGVNCFGASVEEKGTGGGVFFACRVVNFFGASIEEKGTGGVVLRAQLSRLQNLSKALLKRLCECCCGVGRLELLAG